MKISTKLNVSAAVFIMPLAMLFFMLVSASLTSIRKDREELKGIESLRSAAALMRIMPQYEELSFNKGPGGRQYTTKEISELLDALSRNGYVSTRLLLENWTIISGGGMEELVFAAYTRFMTILHDMFTQIGALSGLVTDPELESNYLVKLLIQELPQVQERSLSISALFSTLRNGRLDAARQAELQRYIILLQADHARVRNGFKVIEKLRERDLEIKFWSLFEGPIKAYYGSVEQFAGMLEFTLSRTVTPESLAVLQDAAVLINNNAYRLEEALLDWLEIKAGARIAAYRARLIQSFALAFAAALAAFIINVVTSMNIRTSARNIMRVFKNLENNDLSVEAAVLSRDELGELMKALGGFLEKLKAAFTSFSQNAAMVSTAVYDLSASAKEITTTANEQSASVAEIVNTMENSKNLSEQVAAKTVEVADLAARTQELSLRGANLRDANQDMMQNIRDQNGKIIEEIKNLADMLSRIDESVELIDTIADQTKLIAFNAALEASSSGEAGSRFTVVAGEIRRFADNVVESAAEIKEKISELQEASQALIGEANSGSLIIDAGYTKMVEQKEVFESIVDISQSVATRSQQISNLSRQQELASAQIFTALKEISAGVRQFVTATASTSATADSLNSMSVELKETLAKYEGENK